MYKVWDVVFSVHLSLSGPEDPYLTECVGEGGAVGVIQHVGCREASGTAAPAMNNERAHRVWAA